MGAAEHWECSHLPGWVSQGSLCSAWGSRAAHFCFCTSLEASPWLNPLVQRGSSFLQELWAERDVCHQAHAPIRRGHSWNW